MTAKRYKKIGHRSQTFGIIAIQVFLRDIWPSRADIQAVESKYVIPRMFEVGFLEMY